jgi:hypothetical protein
VNNCSSYTQPNCGTLSGGCLSCNNTTNSHKTCTGYHTNCTWTVYSCTNSRTVGGCGTHQKSTTCQNGPGTSCVCTGGTLGTMSCPQLTAQYMTDCNPN